MTLEHAIDYEHRWFQICLASADKAEGVTAFLEKQEPFFGQPNDGMVGPGGGDGGQ